MTIWNLDYLLTPATYWPPRVNDGYGGGTYGSWQLIGCRWEEVAEKFTSAQGEELTSTAVVWPDFVPALGGYLYLGFSAETDPRAQVGAYEIKKVQRTPELSGDLEEVKAYL